MKKIKIVFSSILLALMLTFAHGQLSNVYADEESGQDGREKKTSTTDLSNLTNAELIALFMRVVSVGLH